MSASSIYEVVHLIIPSWLLWLMMLSAIVQWCIWQWRHTSYRVTAIDLGGMIAPLFPWMVSYSLIFYEDAMGVPSDILRGVALSRLSLVWLLFGLNVLLARPLYRDWRFTK